jgi:hypothetical protein
MYRDFSLRQIADLVDDADLERCSLGMSEAHLDRPGDLEQLSPAIRTGAESSSRRNRYPRLIRFARVWR